MSAVGELVLPEAVVTAAARGDSVAFTRIVARHHDDMVRVAYLISGDADLAHEAVQSAWSTAWLKLKDLRDPERLRSWLVSVAANEARQLLRRRRRGSVREIQIDSMSGLEVADSAARDESIDLLTALGRLPAEDRAIVAMRYDFGDEPSMEGVWVVESDGATPARRLLDCDSPPTPDPSGNQAGAVCAYRIEGFAPDGSALLVEATSGEPTRALESVPTDGGPPTILIPGAFFGTWQWVSDQ